jgi:glycerophosphoryl diester phosphodiesterase
MSRHSVLAGAPLLIAHRGGAGLAPENTIAAFRNAIEQWSADMIELDVRVTADGHCVVIHDATVERTTDGTGTVAAMTLHELQQLDAGYGFTTDAGRTFPFRERGLRVPTIEETLEALPDIPITVEVKTGAAQEPLFAAIRRFNAQDRIVAGGMYRRDRTLFSQYPGAVSASMEDVQRFYAWHRIGLGRLFAPRADVVQMPEQWRGRTLVTHRLVRDLAANAIPVHVWTVNDESAMNRLLDLGVEGLVTDRPDLLGTVLHRRSGRRLATGHTRAGAG